MAIEFKKTVSARILAPLLLVIVVAACGPTDLTKENESPEAHSSIEEGEYKAKLTSAVAQFELEFVNFYLSIGSLTEELLTDFLEHSDDPNKGYLAALKRIKKIDESTVDFFRVGVEVKHLTSDDFDESISGADRAMIMELNPLVVEPMNLVSEFLQTARDAATALSVVDKPKWITLQDQLVEIAQRYYETGSSRGLLYQSLGKQLEDLTLRTSFFELGRAF